ncbi:hypothetical protein [Dactylosporangium sp. NPDC000521]|uniref:hypothetical protein n=1 Tax=Dactylosporangium sp. NPDC000521 TaxID=3363975 RepID=UPI00367EAD5A
MTRTRKAIIAAFAALLLTPALSACNLVSGGACDTITMSIAGKPGGKSGGSSKTKSKSGSKSKSGHDCD